MVNTFSLIRILLYIVMVNIQKILPVKNMELKHLKKEKKMKNLYMANIDKYMQKAMAVKRHPDIPEYKENYKNWKPLALKYLQEYKSGTLDAKTFEKWLKYTSDKKIKSKLKTIDEFKD